MFILQTWSLLTHFHYAKVFAKNDHSTDDDYLYIKFEGKNHAHMKYTQLTYTVWSSKDWSLDYSCDRQRGKRFNCSSHSHTN